MRIEDRELKQLRGKEIALVKVAWGGPAGGNVTWELEIVKFRTYSFLRNRNRRSGSPPTAENAENSAFCLVLAQELLFCLR
ncbi:hypothetical protein KIW84_073528 [Lathyrus oleraceus]|uniref:Uncharacterized protein n=1 Tax=Pisum sativum TaxID=3888 RepID=A0A9D4VRJ7_PEA|nr:hypothetical protein KIW84_073528 [Pisum sativum]